MAHGIDPHTAVAEAARNGHASPEAAERLRELFGLMTLIRRFEPEAERQYKKARIGGYCHLATGQEAAAVGSVAALHEDDYLVVSYRCHGLALARGVSPRAVMAELFGRVDGCAHGRGGSMHLLDVGRNFLGGWGIVGGQIPIATGVSLAIKRDDRPQAVLCELGDGATNIGAWHESLNLAGLWHLPIVYLITDNRYGMGTSVEHASAEPELWKRAAAFRMHGEQVDGDDLRAVLEASERLLARARSEREPAVLHAVTYRWRGHSVADAGLNYRTKDEIEEHRQRDPIERAARWLEELSALDDDAREAAWRSAEEAVEDAVEFAEQSSEPDIDSLAEHVYGDPSFPSQFERMRPGAPFGEDELVFSRGLT
jgi:pyruvate dehydrogenase E1 component alpha subunit